MKLVISVLYLIFTSSGLIFMKLGGDSISLSLKDAFQFKIGFLTLLGLICYIGSFLLWQKLVVTFDLSFIFPIMTGITQVIILLAGHFIFKEDISFINIMGILLVILGIVLITIKK